MPKILENINDIKDCIEKLELLEDKDYIADNGITEDEAKYIKEEIEKEIVRREDEFKGYMEWLSSQRQEINIQAEGWLEESLRLRQLSDGYKKKAEKIEQWMSYLMLLLGKEKVDTNLYHLSFRKSESVEIYDENLLPEGFMKEKTTYAPDKTAIKEALKNGAEIPGATIITKQNLQIK